MDAPISVRLADHSDNPQIASIVNHYIHSSVATFRTETLPESAILETYLSIRAQGLPYLVAVAADTQSILGYAYASGYRMPSHKAYCHTVELTVFVHPDHISRRVGSFLMNDLMFKLKNPVTLPASGSSSEVPGISEVLCIMAVDPAGRGGGYGLRDWYMRWGFEEVGRLKRVGFKFGTWLDTLILQLSLAD
ncbi:hypothetical protein DFH09DRAFT_1054463 [Mycena vulgaris]|nr:hypothetical protein DFH09DRAFT_1054463 [Mycena vulgaris]